MKGALLVVLMLFAAGCVTTDYGKPGVTTTTKADIQPTTSSLVDVKISFVDIPSTVKPSSKFVVKWGVDSNQQKNITHTAVHYGNKSVQGDLSTDVTPSNSGYPDLTPEYVSGVNKIPNEFNTAMVLENKGTIYARAHVIVDGKNYWSDEKSIKVE